MQGSRIVLLMRVIKKLKSLNTYVNKKLNVKLETSKKKGQKRSKIVMTKSSNCAQQVSELTII
jgi:hypothetical protein